MRQTTTTTHRTAPQTATPCLRYLHGGAVIGVEDAHVQLHRCIGTHGDLAEVATDTVSGGVGWDAGIHGHVCNAQVE